MTQLAVISDVHGDVHALNDALEQIDRLGIDRIICCGDLVDYGLFVEGTIALLRNRKVMCIRGNHDRWAARRSGAGSIGWDLTRRSKAFLTSLPATLWMVVDGTRIAMHHARPKNDMAGIAHDSPERELVELLDQAGADVLVVGHTHMPFARRVRDGRLICNPGALLRDPAAGTEVLAPGTFGVLDARRREFAVRRAVDGEIVCRPGESTCVTSQEGCR